MAPDKQLPLPCAQHRGDAAVGAPGERTPGDDKGLMERVVARQHLLTALARVKANAGSPGIDGMPVEELPGDSRQHWPEIRTRVLAGRYRPSPGRRVDIPNPGGGVRTLGMPTVLERFLPQALLPVLQPAWEQTFAEHSDGFRPRRSAYQALARAHQYLAEGSGWVVALALAQCFDRVNHDKLMHLVQGRGADRRVLHLRDRDLTAGVRTGDGFEARTEGRPQGGIRMKR
jgi:RNA-directed DNA polymerase